MLSATATPRRTRDTLVEESAAARGRLLLADLEAKHRCARRESAMDEDLGVRTANDAWCLW